MSLEISNTSSQAGQEKTAAALSSVIAAVGLTTLKIIVGIMTNSLGILAEAAHSGLDLVAALVTFFAVRLSDKPADREHQFGHGKIENLSALFETFLLLATCVWIIYESIQRLFFETVEVEASFWAFLVMGISIGVDYSRSRVLYRAARKHNSQALEADALHFSTDIWSSSVVILGLIGLVLAENVPTLHFLNKADAIAALLVAGIVIYVSIELGIRTVQGLLDQAPQGLAGKIEKAVEAVPGIFDCHRVRVRSSGPSLFIDLHVYVDPAQSLAEAHQLTRKAVEAVQTVAPKSDVSIHAEPMPQPELSVKDKTL
ncbi:MAG TPA: cation diffusion facilitator family transporter [Anaerolineaceae bacterium]|nr:cation diffusion facilitator family transporter [Anaerolineaceae bacterium]